MFYSRIYCRRGNIILCTDMFMQRHKSTCIYVYRYIGYLWNLFMGDGLTAFQIRMNFYASRCKLCLYRTIVYVGDKWSSYGINDVICKNLFLHLFRSWLCALLSCISISSHIISVNFPPSLYNLIKSRWNTVEHFLRHSDFQLLKMIYLSTQDLF